MIGLLQQVTEVLIVVFTTVLAVDLDAASRKHPTKERRGKLVVVSVIHLVGAILRPQHPEQIMERWTTWWPRRMREAAHAELQARNPPQRGDACESRIESPAARHRRG